MPRHIRIWFYAAWQHPAECSTKFKQDEPNYRLTPFPSEGYSLNQMLRDVDKFFSDPHPVPSLCRSNEHMLVCKFTILVSCFRHPGKPWIKFTEGNQNNC